MKVNQKERNRLKHRRYRETNFNGYNDKKKGRSKKWRRGTHKGKIVYAKGLISLNAGIKYADIPNELAETKLLQLTIKNLLKGLKNEKY